MKNSDEKIIDHYLLDQLTGKALVDFENRLQNDADFALAVAEQKRSVDLLRKMGDLEIKMEVQEVHRQFSATQKPSSFFRIIRPWIAAASILLILGISFWTLQKPSEEQLFDRYYTAYDAGLGARDLGNDAQKSMTAASIFYQNKQYKKALPLLESLSSNEDGMVQLMQGICHLELGAYDQAIRSFDQLVAEKDPVFQHHGVWYAAMAYLKSGEINKCKAQLEQLVAIQDTFRVYQQATAKEILENL